MDEIPQAIVEGNSIAHNYETFAAYLQKAQTIFCDGEYVVISACGEERFLYAQLFDWAQRIIHFLQKVGRKRGDIILMDTLDVSSFIACFWACALGGFTFVPVPTVRDLDDKNAAVVRELWNKLGKQTIYTYNNKSILTQVLGETNAQVVSLSSSRNLPPCTEIYPAAPQDVLLLMMTSGTTGESKLAMHTQRTLIVPFADLDKRSTKKSYLYWHPLNHIAGMRLAVPHLHTKLYIPTDLLLEKPQLWLDSIHRYRVNTTVTSNFFLRHLLNSSSNLTKYKWDLSCVTSLSISGEAVNSRTAYDFYHALQPFGLKLQALLTGYGMTEMGNITITRVFSEKELQNPPKLIRAGKPSRTVSVRIVDGDDALLYEKTPGHIQVKSQGCIAGYYQEENDLLFTNDGWMRTGDLGFIDAGILYITGREKEVIIINAKNYNCNDIENAIDLDIIVCGLRRSSDDTDELIVFFECALDDKEYISQVKKRIKFQIQRRFVFTPLHIIPISTQEIPRTSTGKVQRNILQKQLQQGVFSDRCHKNEKECELIAPRSPLEESLCSIWQEVLGIEKVGIEDDFFALGGHSLSAVTLMVKIRQLLGIDEEDYEKLPLAMILTHPTIKQFVEAMNNLSTATSDIIIRMNTEVTDKPPIFLLHVAHVDPIVYRHLCKCLDGVVTTYTIRTEELDKLTSINETAQYHVAKIKKIQPTGPYYLGGMCMGGLVTYEVAQLLREQGDEVRLIFIMDTIHIPGMQKYKSRNKHKAKRWQRKIKNVYKVFELMGHVLTLDIGFIKQKFERARNNIKRSVLKISDPQTKLKKEMRNRLRIIRDNYNPQPHSGEIVYIRSEKEAGKYSAKRFEELATSVKCYQVEGTVHSDVSRPRFAEATARIIQKYFDHDEQNEPRKESTVEK
ncbi:non-ribosomal peptide synthetase [Candidatus Uabimicrobium amorphum]|uniref:Peptide synthase n=1 Tax=Uabimicrobium amorphum TaxID=2596890 RepID=A0A5S9IPR4_UABAM|nr:AMP-binding protein [Candidatus Uabimicrobium amorphum]BBM85843.1 peptide synthase [Candidatus Uabimicrobium amorphum]